MGPEAAEELLNVYDDEGRVVGAQPRLEPGQSFEYTSGAAIATAVGTMKGAYQMVAADGTRFEAPIPEFTLSVPRVLH